MAELTPVKEAAKLVGIHETTIYNRVRNGDVKITYREIDGRKRAFLTATEMAKLKPSERNGRVASRPGPEPDQDPFDVAIDTFIAAAKDLRKAVKEHDKRVRREAVNDLVESLQEGLKK